MKNFEYLQPESLKVASKYLNNNLMSSVFAGGTDILGLMKDHIFSPEHLINLKNIPSMSYLKYDTTDGLKIGALTKLSELENSEIVLKKYPVMHKAIKELATPQLRNIGTIGGNICQRPRCFYFRGDFDCIRKGGDTCYAITGNNKYHCIIGGDPCYIVHPSDTAVALIALEAKFKIFDGKNEKIVPADEFFLLPVQDESKENILQPGEILTEIIVPPLIDSIKSDYIKVKERGAWDFALLSIAGVFDVKGKKINYGRITFGGVAPIPWTEKLLNEKLMNFELNNKNIEVISELAFTEADPLEMNSYKIILAKNLIKKILLKLKNNNNTN